MRDYLFTLGMSKSGSVRFKAKFGEPRTGLSVRFGCCTELWTGPWVRFSTVRFRFPGGRNYEPNHKFLNTVYLRLRMKNLNLILCP